MPASHARFYTRHNGPCATGSWVPHLCRATPVPVYFLCARIPAQKKPEPHLVCGYFMLRCERHLLHRADYLLVVGGAKQQPLMQCGQLDISAGSGYPIIVRVSLVSLRFESKRRLCNGVCVPVYYLRNPICTTCA